MRHGRARARLIRGQVALEYALLVVVVAGAASLIWLFHQGFVLGNLYGGQDLANAYESHAWAQENKALGLEKTVSFPFP
jgi:hypothetical protein